MVRTEAQNAALRAATSERLLMSAMGCFAEQGYSAVTVRKIAARAGLSVGVLYQHYPNKDALLLAAFGRSMEHVRASFALAASTGSNGQLSTLVRAAAATVRAHLSFWQLGYAARHQPEITQALGPALGNWTDEILSVLSTLLRAAGAEKPEVDALALFAQIDGMCVHFALAPDTYPLEAVAERIILNLSRQLRVL